MTNLEDVRKVFADGDITGVVIALGGKTADVGKTMLTDGTTNIITAMKEKDVSRVAAVTSIGAGDSENQAPFFFKVKERGCREGEDMKRYGDVDPLDAFTAAARCNR